MAEQRTILDLVGVTREEFAPIADELRARKSPRDLGLPMEPESTRIFWSRFRDDMIEKVQASHDEASLETLRIQLVGTGGLLKLILGNLRDFDKGEIKFVAQFVNPVVKDIEAAIKQRHEELRSKVVGEAIDVTLPGRKPFVGTYHPLTIVMREITDIFRGMGFKVADGPEIELIHYNFDMLNTPPWHPSRDETDTIYLPNGFVVRTETSPVQIRTMEAQRPPVRVISPGRVYRRDRPDATHSPMFHQCEGLYVDEGVTMADLKGTLLEFYRKLFGATTKLRMRPHFFPFTEPSAEVDVSCFFCKGAGCRVCKHTGWLEMGGCGMVDPNVLTGVGYDAEKYTGYAFGLGIERIVMLRFGIDNIRLLLDSDVRFLRQFVGVV